jgi:hypothetical protein
MAKDSAFDLALIAAINVALFSGIQSFLTTNYPEVDQNSISITATFISTFVMAYLFRRKRKRSD